MGYSYLNLISFIGIFALCLIAWIFSEDRKYVPWRVIGSGIALQLLLGFFVFQFPLTREILNIFSKALDGVFAAADAGANFVFGYFMVPTPGLVPGPSQAPFIVRALPPGATQCPPPQIPFLPGYCGTDRLSYIFAFRSLPAVIFFSALMSLLYNIGVIQVVTNFFAKVFYRTMRLSGAESLSGAANIFVGIEAAIAVKPYIPKMTRSELCAILACCFGTAASSTLAIYVGFLKGTFPNILGHLVSASIIAIPACFVLSKILVPETGIPVTAGGIPVEEDLPPEEIDPEDEQAPTETVGGEPIERVSPLDAAIVGALDGVKMAVSIAAVLILIVGLVYLLDLIFDSLASLRTFGDVVEGTPPPPEALLPLAPIIRVVGQFFNVVNLQNIEGALFYIPTLLTGVPFDESWKAAVIIGRRLTETAIPPYQELGRAATAGELSSRTVLIVSYALSGFAHVASVGIFVGGTIALAPSRRKDISQLGWKALFIGTLATLMIACVAGVYDNGNPSIFGEKKAAPPPAQVNPAASPLASPTAPASPSATTTPSVVPTSPAPVTTPSAAPIPPKRP
ncbi:nucleoside:proton symporter [Leptolyngbya sp. 'hensonii']|uniref:NupC/NupG family nucleoside CNT transporter n=1 Tax=Leptolyngbya sp. 'hensonii' TaxID=1922337 RepID=UPI00094FB823|nr:nucleoside transporter C-terminal domain-containing protein [Leptolyngbya sp. 'hensonii']OLP19710.1 nucleoside:proton symporter [Leptolyngbya sp. 'hensonii']